MSWNVRPITEAEVPAFREQIARGFGEGIPQDDEARFLETFELPRLFGAFDSSQLVGTCGGFTFDVTVPGGGTLPMGGTTIVTVLSTHRRRGVLRAMMQAHFDDICAHEEPLAGLWASEATIYGRFGYGLAAEMAITKVDANQTHFPMPANDGRCKWLEGATAREVLSAIFERVRPTRPGMTTRHANWWKWKIFDDPEHRRAGWTACRFIVHEGEDGPDGYAIYRQRRGWADFPEGEVKIQEIVTATDRAREALWRHLLSIDLFPRVQYINMPIDDPLPWLVTEHRRVRRTPVDSLWIRVMDVTRALAGRAYSANGSVVLAIDDAMLPQNTGRYHLRVDGESVLVARTDLAADVEMDAETLGAIYLGGTRAAHLAQAGRMRGDADAIKRVDRMFHWPVAPWCQEEF